jgi:RHS repeat-associated protein
LGDNQGTIRDLVRYNSGTGNTSVVDHLTYSAFGAPLSGLAADFLFGYTGRFYDQATGLQRNLNRWYDPSVGKWLSEDPSGLAVC